MHNKWFKSGMVLLVVAVLAISAVVTFAQGRYGDHMGGESNSLVTVAAEVIGIDQAELVKELQKDLTIADIAEAHDVTLGSIVDAFVAARAEWLTSAVESERLTQEQADLMLANMRAHVTLQLSASFEPQSMGFMGEHGMGGGMHGGMGHGRGMGPGMGFNHNFCDHCPFGTPTETDSST